MLILAWTSSLASAAGGVSDPQAVTFLDDADLFTTFQFDTGYWPSATDPIAIRLFLTPLGGVHSTLLGTSEVAWHPLGHRVTSDPGGLVVMDALIAIGAEIRLDLAGVYTGVVPLWTEEVSFAREAEFDGLLLPGHPVEAVLLETDDPGLIPDLEYSLSVIPGVDLVAAVSLTPAAAAEVRGTGIITDAGGDVLVQGGDSAWTDLLPDPNRPGELGMASRWTGEVDARLDLVIEPEIRVDTFLGDFTLARFPIPVTLVEAVSPRESQVAYAVHPLPVLATLDPEQAFGGVEVGSVNNRAVPLDNLGDLLLEATLRVEGDPSFSVWPPTIAATPDGPTGFVVTYAPTERGAHTGRLVIDSNDPTLPLVSIDLSGSAGSDPLPGPDGVDGGSSHIKTCGCAAGPSGGPAAGWLVAGLLPLTLRRRTPGAASRTSGSPRPR